MKKGTRLQEPSESKEQISLRIAKNLQLPAEAVTQTFAILAKRGVGKTYTASVLVEEMLKAGLHVVVVDPIGVWWGLRSSADGTREGLPIVIAGGEHADVPIEPGSGGVLAELVVSHRISLVVDLSVFRKGEQHRFMTDFAETLYRKNRQAVHLVLDEADEFAPQRTIGEEARMLGAIEDLVRRGRARGIGVTMITQRPAVLNKNVLTQIEVLIAMRLTSPQDRAAIAEWIKYHADTSAAKSMLESLGSLPIGTAWFWSPGWLDIFTRVAVRSRETLDSSSTPTVGQQPMTAQKMAKVDLAALRGQLAATLEKAASDDPKVLKRRVAELEKALARQPAKVEVHEVPVLTDEQVRYLREQLPTIAALLERVVSALHVTKGGADRPVVTPLASDKAATTVSRTDKTPIIGPAESETLRDGERRILEVLAQHAPMKFTRNQLGRLSKFSPSGGAFGSYFATLKRLGLLEEVNGEVFISDRGAETAGVVRPTPQTLDETLRMWRAVLREGERKLFDVLVALYPEAIARDELGQQTGFTPSGGAFGSHLASLKRNGLVEAAGDQIKASDVLFTRPPERVS